MDTLLGNDTRAKLNFPSHLSRWFRGLTSGIISAIAILFIVACSTATPQISTLLPTPLPTATHTLSTIDFQTETLTPEPSPTATSTPQFFIGPTPTQSTYSTPKPGVVINAANAENLKVVASWYADTGVDGYPYWLQNSGDILIASKNKVTLFDKTTFLTKRCPQIPKNSVFFFLLRWRNSWHSGRRKDFCV